MAPRPPFSVRRPPPRGFTLTELMVAITGGMLLALSVFALARDGTRFYHREGRIGDATLGAVVGFQRLQADLQRAGFMASPNLGIDPRICGARPTSPHVRLKDMGALRLTDQTSPLPSVFADTKNNLNPDVVTISGAFGSVDEFPIRGVRLNGTAFEVDLQTEIGPLNRLGFELTGGAAIPDTEKTAILREIFAPGRGLRIVDQAGAHYYGRIVNAFYIASPQRTYLTLATVPSIPLKSDASTLCALTGSSLGSANVVNFVRYELRQPANVTGVDYSALYGGTGGAASTSDLARFESTRTDLVRYEVDTQDNMIANTMEVVAEYAVNLKLGVTVLDQSNVVTASQANLITLPPGDANLPTWTGHRTLTNAAVGHPDRIRAVRVRFAVRSPLPDRYQPIAADTNVAPGLYRMWLLTEGGREYWARVRSLQADVGLRNLEDILWP